jgi:hypothetical protein
LFLSNRGTRITPRQVARRLDDWLVRAGIGKRLSPHGLRHTFTTHLYDATSDLLVVQRPSATATSRRPRFTPTSLTADSKRRSNASESRPAFPRSLVERISLRAQAFVTVTITLLTVPAEEHKPPSNGGKECSGKISWNTSYLTSHASSPSESPLFTGSSESGGTVLSDLFFVFFRIRQVSHCT